MFRLSALIIAGCALAGCPSNFAPPSVGLLFEVGERYQSGHDVHVTDSGAFAVVGNMTSADQESSHEFLLLGDRAGVGNVYTIPLPGLFDSGYGYRRLTASALLPTGHVCVAGDSVESDSFQDSDYEMRAVLFESSGETVWDLQFSGQRLRADSVLTVADGILIVGMTIDSFGAGDAVFVMKLSLDGNVLWFKTHSVETDADRFYLWDAIVTSNGMIAYSGASTTLSGAEQGIRLVDQDGNLLWTKLHGVRGKPVALAQLADGGFVTASRSLETNQALLLVRTDSAGNPLWVLDDATAGVVAMDQFDPLDLMVDIDDDIVLTGVGTTVRYISTFPRTSTSYWLISFSSAGQLQWQTELPDANTALGLTETTDGYATTGSYAGQQVNVIFYNREGEILDAKAVR